MTWMIWSNPERRQYFERCTALNTSRKSFTVFTYMPRFQSILVRSRPSFTSFTSFQFFFLVLILRSFFPPCSILSWVESTILSYVSEFFKFSFSIHSRKIKPIKAFFHIFSIFLSWLSCFEISAKAVDSVVCAPPLLKVAEWTNLLSLLL